MLWKIMSTAGPVLASQVTRKGMTAVWEGIVGTTPPDNPEDPDTDWVEAIAWSALLGALVGVARMMATRQATRAHEKMTGKTPKSVEKSRAARR